MRYWTVSRSRVESRRPAEEGDVKERRGGARLTIGGWTLLAVAGAIFGASFVHRVNLLLLLFTLILAVGLVGALVGRRQLRGLSIRRVFPPLVAAGHRCRVLVEVESKDTRPSVGLMLQDQLRPTPPMVLPTHGLPTILPSQPCRASYEMVIPRRGEYQFGSLHLSTAYPFGLVRWWKSVRTEGNRHLYVHPPIHELTVVAQERLGLASLGEGRAQAGLSEGIDEFRGVRDYRDGDPPRLIHWRSTARRGALVVRELDPAASRNLLLLVHLRLERGRPARLAEDVLSFAASIIAVVCKDPTLQLTLVVAGGEGMTIRGSASRVRRPTYLRSLAKAQITTEANTLAEACRRLNVRDVRDRRLCILTPAGLRPDEEAFLRGGAFRRVSARQMLNASAGDLDELWTRSRANRDSTTPDLTDATDRNGLSGVHPTLTSPPERFA